MSRIAFGLLGIWSVLATATPATAQRLQGGIIPENVAQRHGLHRNWVLQLAMDPGRGRIEYVTLKLLKLKDETWQGLLLIQTDQASLHVLDAETRRTLWVAQVGQRKYPTSAPTCNSEFVVSTNGGTLFLFDRRDGRLIWERPLESVPSAGAVIGGGRVYVPLVTGMVAGYRLPQPGDDKVPAEQVKFDKVLHYRGNGVADSPPIYTENSVVWGTIGGDVCAVTGEDMFGKFRFRTRKAICAPLAYSPPFIYAASRDGYVYGLRDERGRKRWQFAAGNPVVEQPVVIDDALYVISETGDLFKLKLDSGLEEWSVRGISRFVSGSETKLYMVDMTGRLLVLDSRTGARLGAIATEYLPLEIINTQTDRIYLGSPSGMIQCLRERELVEPFRHTLAEPVTDGEDDEGDKKAAKPADAGDKEGKPDVPADDDDNPFADKPAADDEMKDDE
ncbi:MAG TPA: PQQ-binding-like beta-propeller repeat protein [Pirellulales bacterium]|nr:PQQ-binding-like beta-propeller repeat protein [Pirellulales bacterium]